jgi:hypothetical protein
MQNKSRIFSIGLRIQFYIEQKLNKQFTMAVLDIKSSNFCHVSYQKNDESINSARKTLARYPDGLFKIQGAGV